MGAGRRPRSVAEGDAPSARAASLASSAAEPVPCRSAWRGRVGPHARPYAAQSRTPVGAGGGFVLVKPLEWRKRRLAPRGNGADRPSGALRAIDSTACPRSWRTCGPRRLRRQSEPALVTTQGDPTASSDRPPRQHDACRSKPNHCMDPTVIIASRASSRVSGTSAGDTTPKQRYERLRLPEGYRNSVGDGLAEPGTRPSSRRRSEEAADAEVIDVVLFPQGKQIPPGKTIGMRAAIDVSGAQHITVNVEIFPNTGSVWRRISFGRRREDEEISDLVQQKVDRFAETTSGGTGILLTFVPVHGPLLDVELQNRGDKPVDVLYATVYGIRETTSSAISDTPGSGTDRNAER